MSTIKQYKLAEKRMAEQRQVVGELDALVTDIDRCVNSVNTLQAELTATNARFQKQRTTREEIAYLEELLRCANKKLAWEKQLMSVKKRTPAILERMTKLINDPDCPPDDAVRAEMLRALQGVQSAMQKLQELTAGMMPPEPEPDSSAGAA